MKRSLLLLILLPTILVVQAQENFTDKLIGHWDAKGTSFGLPSETMMIWEPALSNKFVRLRYRILMHPKQGADQVFEGEAMYKPSGVNTLTATWFDSQGSIHPITATHDEISLISLWGTPGAGQGKTIYTLNNDGTLSLADFTLALDGTWKPFNKGIFTRK